MVKDSQEPWGQIRKRVFIIAEIGKNFIQSSEEKSVEEYLANAKKLVDAAVTAGADAIKFQTHNVDDEQLNVPIISPHAKGLDRYTWITRNTKATPVNEFWKPLKNYCETRGIVFFSTPMSRGAARRLAEVGVSLWKIGSADILDFVMMDFIRSHGEPVIMSSGMSTFEEVELGLNFLRAKNERVVLMHSLSKYPGLPEEANLSVLQLYKEKFPGVPIGFSENSTGIEPSMIAAALGAALIEKHLTIRRDLWGADHKTSSTPEEFKEMVTGIRRMERDSAEKQKWLQHPKIKEILGKKEKWLYDDEAVLRPIWRKSLMAGQDIAAGDILAPEMIYAMRPQKHAGGLPSENYELVLGKRATRVIRKFEPLTWDILS